MNTPLQDLAHLAGKISSMATQVELELAEDDGKRTKYFDQHAGLAHAVDLWMATLNLRTLIHDATTELSERNSKQGSQDSVVT